jgi:hypothetical protein
MCEDFDEEFNTLIERVKLNARVNDDMSIPSSELICAGIIRAIDDPQQLAIGRELYKRHMVIRAITKLTVDRIIPGLTSIDDAPGFLVTNLFGGSMFGFSL